MRSFLVGAVQRGGFDTGIERRLAHANRPLGTIENPMDLSRTYKDSGHVVPPLEKTADRRGLPHALRSEDDQRRLVYVA